jgi:two-component system, chemotaxis family, chemotaxis protein CheY
MPAEAVRQHRCSVLVVDDDADVRELLRVALTAEGYDVAGVDNGREALHYLRSHADICIILLDLMLPMMDGASFRRTQLRDRSLAWIPIVIMSAADDAPSRARELGARRLVRKPLNIDEVRTALRHIGCCQARPRSSRSAERFALTV